MKAKLKRAMARPDGTLAKFIVWKSPRGGTVVVEGPFPEGFVRSLTSKTIVGAAKMSVDELYARRGTTEAGHYAKVHACDISPSHNEWGEIAP